MTRVLDAARAWQQAGVSVIPIRLDASKAPAVSWLPYQKQAAGPEEVDAWFEQGRHGLAIVCGAVSGNLEMTELEADATSGDALDRVQAACDRLGVLDVWSELMSNGYMEWTPSGGIHLLYRVEGDPVPGNTKLAWREAHPQELNDSERKVQERFPTKKFYRVLSETRGEGGYVIVAPTPGSGHPSGEEWGPFTGSYGTVPTLTREDRDLLHAAIREALDEMPPPPPPMAERRELAPVEGSGEGLTPGDDFNRRGDWAQILEGEFEFAYEHGGIGHWKRVGSKNRVGATTNALGTDRLKVHSTSTVFTDESVSKFGAYAILRHGGDYAAAARDLRAQGYGDQRPSPTAMEVPDALPRPAGLGPEPMRPRLGDYMHNDLGNARRIYDTAVGDNYHLVPEYGERPTRWMRWDGTRWVRDLENSLSRVMHGVVDELRAEASQAYEAAVAGGDKEQIAEAKKFRTFATGSGNDARVKGAISQFSTLPGVSVRAAGFDTHRHVINLPNGMYDLDTDTFTPGHDKRMRMTRVFGAAYDPQATAPRWERFLEEVLPNPKMRDYVQRAIGYTLLGDADQRAMFLLHGPSGTGKSQFAEAMRMMFADYGRTAAASTFRRKRGESPTSDLHDLRGARFVTTSETSQDTGIDEELLKRITGRDTISSRGLYESNQEWMPECAIWVATNFLPRMDGDDNAVWARVKPIEFPTQFDRATAEPNLASRMVQSEAAGILNWMLEGVRKYLLEGLGEPQELESAVSNYRRDSDNVAQFIDEAIEDEIIERDDEARIGVTQLNNLYLSWCSDNHHRPYGSKRFSQRLMALGFEIFRSNGKKVKGLKHDPAKGFTGGFR